VLRHDAATQMLEESHVSLSRAGGTENRSTPAAARTCPSTDAEPMLGGPIPAALSIPG
jgi:hypothetical protein